MQSTFHHTQVKIGTSGWSYDDWVGPFYPSDMRTRKGDWLAFYGKHFNTVEINSSFYRMPTERMVERWVEVGKKLGDFEFSLKLPQAVTHEALVEARGEEAAAVSSEFENRVIEPLAEAHLLGCILVQLSPFFQRFEKKSGGDNHAALESLFETFSYSKYPYVAEFRHSSWLNSERDDLQSETQELLRKYNIGLCKTDGPGFPATRTDTAPHCYIRFHGRNDDIWFKGKKFEEEKKRGGAGADPRFNRYDYLYTESELEPWVPEVKAHEGAEGTKKRLYFNNHPNGQAVKNAFMMMDMVGLPRKLKGFTIQEQQKLF
jgi:uncharacterized protein YecE (DUF72 family)